MVIRSDKIDAEVREAMRGGKGSIKLEHWLKPEDFGGKVRLCSRLTLPPGTSIGEHDHVGEDEIYIVISGTGLVLEKDGATALNPGDVVLTGRGASHGLENNGKEPLVIAAIIVQY